MTIAPTYSLAFKHLDLHKWLVLEVTDAIDSLVPDNVAHFHTGHYRIRSLNGIYVLTMPSESRVGVYLARQEAGNEYQKASRSSCQSFSDTAILQWHVDDKGNDEYTIKNVGQADITLSCESTNIGRGVKVYGVPDDKATTDWELKSIGIFGHL
jgi:hypothetical protein